MKKAITTFVVWIAMWAFLLLFVAAVASSLASCTSQEKCKKGKPCFDSQRHDRRPFRVYRINRSPDGSAIVSLWRYSEFHKVEFKCLPDTIQVGKFVMYPVL